MSNSTPQKTPATTAVIDAGTRDELDKILDEVEQLQKELNGTGDTGPLPSEGGPTAKFEIDASNEGSMEETLAELPETPVESADAIAFDEDEVEVAAAGAVPSAPAALTSVKSGAMESLTRSGPNELASIANIQEVKENVMKFPQTQAQSAAPAQTTTATDNSDTPGASGTLSMTLSGSMTLKLNYEFEGQTVTVGFADECLKISLADGTEFKIPVGSRSGSGSARGQNRSPMNRKKSA
jgi:septal ring-binding cell division protein DamX